MFEWELRGQRKKKYKDFNFYYYFFKENLE